ncbi:hypothetical protein TNIN_500541 [Trichonephila inaurata madagascariensis]|uniref:Uncharacterized protein n=1 Tax=Trichonephila inaurata madagascariensis TaxID=2747483 RepID=A0A8X6JC05_9ARAC|nr:hypothetical protein TNIN_500541 [Trichonephila inaurata madagascariensis]
MFEDSIMEYEGNFLTNNSKIVIQQSTRHIELDTIPQDGYEFIYKTGLEDNLDYSKAHSKMKNAISMSNTKFIPPENFQIIFSKKIRSINNTSISLTEFVDVFIHSKPGEPSGDEKLWRKKAKMGKHKYEIRGGIESRNMKVEVILDQAELLLEKVGSIGNLTEIIKSNFDKR